MGFSRWKKFKGVQDWDVPSDLELGIFLVTSIGFVVLALWEVIKYEF